MTRSLQTAPASEEALVRGRTTFTTDLGVDTGHISLGGYIDPDYYQREIELIWEKAWLEVGRLHAVSTPGSFFVRDLPGLNVSVLVTRGKDGTLRAFHNICGHRCNKLVWASSGNLPRFRCNYHGWTYRADGTLAGVSDEKNFYHLDKAELDLTPIHVDTWEDFVFINLDRNPAQALRQFIGKWWTEFEGYPFSDFTQIYEWRGEVSCNWKAARDAFVETYHAPYLHRRTFGKAFSSPGNPNANSIAFNTSGHHVQNSLYANLQYVPPPMELLALNLGGSSLMDKREKELKLAPAVNPSRGREWSSDINAIFPGTVLVTFPDFILHFNIQPLAVDKCIFEARQCMAPARNATERWAHEVANVTFHTGILEDFLTMENSQIVMSSRVRDVMPLQDNELAVRHAHLTNQAFAGPYPIVEVR
jgi:phenylpropionate dioxygenase-like ring-hydroxylating dioxygenase large terminal subunit